MLFVHNRVYHRDGAGIVMTGVVMGTTAAGMARGWEKYCGDGDIFVCGVGMGMNCRPHVTLSSVNQQDLWQVLTA